jgi:glutamate/tyrosine decarboxylase-like PLP-dependent enzyme
MLGMGRGCVQTCAGQPSGRLDVDAFERALSDLGGRPAIVIANAGEVNTGAFDPIAQMADLTERHGAWLHVDGAFGLFARVTPLAAHLTEGVERADSVAGDAHKWLNVPHDCGFAFVRNPDMLTASFTADAAYLPAVEDRHPNFAHLGPEISRRARGLAVWATLHAYGRAGYRAMVERHLALTQRLAQRIDDSPIFERLADAPLNIVCFRYHPPNIPEHHLDALNAQLGEAMLADGRAFVGTTRYEGRVAFRPTIVNWRCTERDVDLLLDILAEIGERIASG